MEGGGEVDATRNAERLAVATETYIAVGAAGKDQRIERVLNGLGFSRDDHNRSCTEFSGGWQMRVALARLLLSEPDLLLLDEPTNHLDLQAKKWLTGYLAQYEGTIVVVTHEESLLEAIKCTAIAEIRDQKLHYFRCGYRKFMEERQERVERAQREYIAQQKEIAHLQSYIDRFGAKANLAASAQSRKKKIEKMDVLDAPDSLQNGRKPKLVLPAPPKCRSDMVMLEKARIGWGGGSSSERSWMYDNLDLTVNRGMRMVILGPNGAGKSTLLWALAGRLELLAGKRKITEGLRLGFFTQDLAQELDPSRVALEIVLESVQTIDATITQERARTTMGALGLTGSKALQTIGTMSGGEKARVALSMFVLVPHNLLLLDEPSNHLDVAAVDALTTALVEYTGTIVVVTHNRDFCEKIKATHVAMVKGDGGITVTDREVRQSDWDEISQLEKASNNAVDAAAKAEEKVAAAVVKEQKQLSYEQQKKRSNAPKRIEKIEKEISKLENSVEKIDTEMMSKGSDVEALQKLQAKRDDASLKIDAFMEEWEQLEELMA
mmetsp:Transcript_64848/g.104985  ORF Transcript_64848/g.104985 Transcript_64848/m.104985 type:complete len:550 (+) Transcript_64848:2-1651(+)